eukprot:TRINITY_DN9703_c0_g1_i2.p1 TRINITY_DN9703_c0_g1~~TRINITY_DN9703_c0_g1_i2.p1  ORF type:complete len:549 (+),score=127.40 TRINITY_DN9703_c0_g1_i2:188-1834(+)
MLPDRPVCYCSRPTLKQKAILFTTDGTMSCASILALCLALKSATAITNRHDLLDTSSAMLQDVVLRILAQLSSSAAAADALMLLSSCLCNLCDLPPQSPISTTSSNTVALTVNSGGSRRVSFSVPLSASLETIPFSVDLTDSPGRVLLQSETVTAKHRAAATQTGDIPFAEMSLAEALVARDAALAAEKAAIRTTSGLQRQISDMKWHIQDLSHRSIDQISTHYQERQALQDEIARLMEENQILAEQLRTAKQTQVPQLPPSSGRVNIKEAANRTATLQSELRTVGSDIEGRYRTFVAQQSYLRDSVHSSNELVQTLEEEKQKLGEQLRSAVEALSNMSQHVQLQNKFIATQSTQLLDASDLEDHVTAQQELVQRLQTQHQTAMAELREAEERREFLAQQLSNRDRELKVLARENERMRAEELARQCSDAVSRIRNSDVSMSSLSSSGASAPLLPSISPGALRLDAPASPKEFIDPETFVVQSNRNSSPAILTSKPAAVTPQASDRQSGDDVHDSPTDSALWEESSSLQKALQTMARAKLVMSKIKSP